jgi:N-acetylglucosaminyldiphosphoundecaprenol N-acetyl-beta-D-mannosaminyltransferase
MIHQNSVISASQECLTQSTLAGYGTASLCRTKAPSDTSRKASPIAILGVSFDNVTSADTITLVEEMVKSQKPHYAATANVDFVVQALGDVELRRILLDAHLVLADGMPLVWVSRWLGNPLPERVTGSDMVPRLLAEAERKGWRVFFLGGTEQSVAAAAKNSQARHPNLKLVGAYAPPFKPLMEMDHDDLVRRVREARPDILFVAFGCPKQEKWINMHYRKLKVPLCIGVGATIDFLAGTVSRAPRWMQRSGLEWCYRLCQEPKRLFQRYMTDLRIFGFTALKQYCHFRARARQAGKSNPVELRLTDGDNVQVLAIASRLDATAVHEHESAWQDILTGQRDLILDLSRCEFIDSTGIGLLARLQKTLQAANRYLVLTAPSKAVIQALNLMCLNHFITAAPDLQSAHELLYNRRREKQVVVEPVIQGESEEPLAWQGEVVAANAEEVWQLTATHLDKLAGRHTAVTINLGKLRFIDSSGVGLMIRARKHGQQRGLAVAFTAPQPAVRNVIRLLRMETQLLGGEA